MPERYALYKIDKLTDRFNLKNGVPRGVKPSYNISPTQHVSVIISKSGVNELKLMNWGLLPANSTNTNSVFRYKTFDTKSEGVFNKHSTAKAIRSQRCLVPANGFYEWQKTSDGKQPFYVRPNDRDLFAFAGIYSSWQDADSKEWGTFSILTIDSNKEMNTINPRMPIILQPDEESTWLDPNVDDMLSIYNAMRPSDDGALDIQLANPKVNSVKASGEELIVAPTRS